MKDGIYKVNFKTGNGSGTGIVVFASGSVRGGDSLMYYTGTVKESENEIKVSLRVRKHSDVPGMRSVLGSDDANLELSGTSTNDTATVSGSPVGMPSISFEAQLNLLE